MLGKSEKDHTFHVYVNSIFYVKKKEEEYIDNLDISIIIICFHVNFSDKMLLKIITVLLILNLIESSL